MIRYLLHSLVGLVWLGYGVFVIRTNEYGAVSDWVGILAFAMGGYVFVNAIKPNHYLSTESMTGKIDNGSYMMWDIDCANHPYYFRPGIVGNRETRRATCISPPELLEYFGTTQEIQAMHENEFARRCEKYLQEKLP